MEQKRRNKPRNKSISIFYSGREYSLEIRLHNNDIFNPKDGWIFIPKFLVELSSE